MVNCKYFWPLRSVCSKLYAVSRTNRTVFHKNQERNLREIINVSEWPILFILLCDFDRHGEMLKQYEKVLI